eukprot:3933197-Rhodomonas_salina.1
MLMFFQLTRHEWLLPGHGEGAVPSSHIPVDAGELCAHLRDRRGVAVSFLQLSVVHLASPWGDARNGCCGHDGR